MNLEDLNLPAPEWPEGHKSGYVAILGKPNAGKSTLLNALLEYKLSIATYKAQTTRHRIVGLQNADDYQIVWLDTPGVIDPEYKLHEAMMRQVRGALQDADVVLLLVVPEETHSEESLFKLLEPVRTPLVLAVNKADLAGEAAISARQAEFKKRLSPAETLAISALKEENLDELQAAILRLLPEAPPYYPKDQLSDRPERFFAAELIREQVFLHLSQELPYSAEIQVVKFDEREDLTFIDAEIHVERKSQKGMVIGKGGTMLRKIGTAARLALEEMLGRKVFLNLYVRVSEKWKDKDLYLRGFGYK